MRTSPYKTASDDICVDHLSLTQQNKTVRKNREKREKCFESPQEHMTSSSPPSSPSTFLDLGSAIGQKEVKRILVLFLGLAALLIYKTAYPSHRDLHLDYLTSPLPLLNHTQTRTKSPSLREVLENASIENRTVIVTTLNKAWAEPNSMFDLFLKSFHIGQGTQKLVQHLVVVCLDSKALDRCSQIHPNCYNLETEGTDFSGEKLFATPDYLKMMWRRIELLTQVLEMGYNFIFTDADIMWLRDPFPRLYPEGDLQIACDRYFGDPNNTENWVNGGFTYVKSNNRSIEFYKFWYKSRLDYPGLHDQDVFNKIKNDTLVSEIGIKMRFLDTLYFGGFCEKSKYVNLVCTMHANCCVGLKKKVRSLNRVLDGWRKYLYLSEYVKNRNMTWSVPIKCK